MGLTASDNGGGGSFTPAPEGTHLARCVRVVDMGTQPGSQMYPTPKHRVQFVWELPHEQTEYEGKTEPSFVIKRYTMSLHEKASLRHDLESWRGRQFTADELSGFELKKVLGAPCMISIVHSDDHKYANIKAVTACPKGMDVPDQHHPSVYFEIEDGASEAFQKFSPKMQEAIRQAPEWKGPSDPDTAPDNGDPGFGDSDIPF